MTYIILLAALLGADPSDELIRLRLENELLRMRVEALEQRVADQSAETEDYESKLRDATGVGHDGTTFTPAQAVPPTMRELSAFAASYGNAGKPFTDVRPRNQVWNHLMRDHGFSFEQIDGMQYNAALWLHAAAHNGDVTPTEIKWKAVPVLKGFNAISGQHWQPVQQNCANGQCYNRSYRFDD